MSSPYLLEKKGRRSMDKTKRGIKPLKAEKLENTYRLDPPRLFNPCRAAPVIRKILEKHLMGRCYDPRFQAKITTAMTEEIKSRIKALNYPRYRFVVFMAVGEKQDQGLRVASRCVWDKDRDNFVSVTFENNQNLFAVVTVYAVYYE